MHTLADHSEAFGSAPGAPTRAQLEGHLEELPVRYRPFWVEIGDLTEGEWGDVGGSRPQHFLVRGPYKSPGRYYLLRKPMN
ncbi:hypothetical protein EVAR_44274_1 [Eumeta japonica]|uniref:Uncharacterized protein n=1 Tax=Eumeta variegata TaxID=151549 RepID=A0A4C1WQK6_EUMVA|nr:hypothetical protein EVAR_44274_1 [Eumeta japonica]